jgi:hypothetical protein
MRPYFGFSCPFVKGGRLRQCMTLSFDPPVGEGFLARGEFAS